MYAVVAYGCDDYGGVGCYESMSIVYISAPISIATEITSSLDISAFEITLGQTGFPTVIDDTRNLLVAANNKSVALTSSIAADDMALTVTGSLAGWPNAGALTLDTIVSTATSSEIAYYDGISGQVITLVDRGVDSTTAKAFSAGSRVELRHVARHHNVLAEAIIATEAEVLSHTGQIANKTDIGHTHVPADVTGLDADLASKLPLAGGTMTGALTLAAAPTLDLHAATKRYVDYISITTWNAKNYGCAGDGSTDDTAAIIALQDAVFAAGGGRIFFPKGEYIVGGPLLDPTGHNAQIPIPLLSQYDPSITIEWVGEAAPPTTCSVQPRPTGQQYSIIKSTITTGSGNASVVGGKQIPGDGTTNGTIWNAKDIVFECPTNPTLTALDFSNQLGNRLENVLIHCGSLMQNPPAGFEPTHTNAYGVKLSPTNHASRCDVSSLNVLGFYVGVRSGELAYGSVCIQACKVGYEIPFAYHPTKLNILGVYGCPICVKAAGDGVCAVIIDLLSLQDDVGVGAAWQAVVYEVDDPGNLLYGTVTWANVQGGVGVTHIFRKNGGVNLIDTDVFATGALGEFQVEEIAHVQPIPLERWRIQR